MPTSYIRGPAILIGFMPMTDRDANGKIACNFTAFSAYVQNVHYHAGAGKVAAYNGFRNPHKQLSIFGVLLDERAGFDTMVVSAPGQAVPLAAPPVPERVRDLDLIAQRWAQLDLAQRALYPINKGQEESPGRFQPAPDTETLGAFLLQGARLTRLLTGGETMFAANITSLSNDGVPLQTRPLQVVLENAEVLRVINYNNATRTIESFTVVDPRAGAARP